jgi:hypothetical protein
MIKKTNSTVNSWRENPAVRSLSVALAMSSFVFSYVGCVTTNDAVSEHVPPEGTVAQMETYGAIDSIDTPNSQREDFESKVMDKRFENELEQSPFAETKPSGEILALQERNLKDQELLKQKQLQQRKIVKTSSKSKKVLKSNKKTIQRKNFVVVPGKKYKVAKRVTRQK